jgi:isoprenylcysteine carboxyl methyltransferase (ICMT) family protein YpbQ
MFHLISFISVEDSGDNVKKVMKNGSGEYGRTRETPLRGEGR